MVYLEFLTIIVLMLILGFDKHIKLETYILIPVIFMALITGLRFETGSDLINYEFVFDWLKEGRIADYEISYILICKLVQLIHGKFQLVVLVYAILSYLFIYKALLNIVKSKLEAATFICFFYAMMFSTYFILMRQFLAASIIIYALSRDDENIIVKYVFLVLAGMFHYGAFVIIPFYIIINSKLLNKNWKRIIVLAIVFLVGRGVYTLEIIDQLVDVFERYAYYIEKTNYGTNEKISVLILLLSVIYIAFLFINIRNDFKEGIFDDDLLLSADKISKGILLTLIIYFGTIMVGWFHRAYWYSYMFVAFLPLWSSRFFNKDKSKIIYQFLWILVIIIYAIYFYITLEASQPNMFPYKYSLDLF